MPNMTEPLIEQRRASALAALVEPGGRRKAATSATQNADEELRPLVVTAVKAGCSYRRIRELTGLSLDTISAWAHSAAAK
jgi:DNA-directed RNA polymerase specialized sigma24 family protein